MSNIIFIDRDGVLNENRDDYVKSCSELVLIKGAREALEILKSHGYRVIVISNQSAVGRGLLTEKELMEINGHLNHALGGNIDDFFYCPHKPDDGCDCRKPKTKLVTDAAKKYGIELEGKWMIGDNISDILLGKNAGLKTILVRTGLGESVLKSGDIEPDHTADDLLNAVLWLVEGS